MGAPPAELTFREATSADVPAMLASRDADPEWGPGDARTAAYLEGTHHPNRALPPRAVFLAEDGDAVVGYIAGHLTTRYECDGEVQWLWVAPEHRRSGVASRLLRLQAEWFVRQEACRVCVDVVPENVRARSFYRRHGAIELNPSWVVWENVSTVSGGW